MLSVARIPWIGNAFTGFLGFFLFQGKRYDFATYTGAKLNLKIEESGSVHISITGKNFPPVCKLPTRQSRIVKGSCFRKYAASDTRKHRCNHSYPTG
jgi:hypothetical protein